jgi:hypothetical protein
LFKHTLWFLSGSKAEAAGNWLKQSLGLVHSINIEPEIAAWRIDFNTHLLLDDEQIMTVLANVDSTNHELNREV